MKYDIKTLIEKNEKLEELILNMNCGYNNPSIGSSSTVSFEDDFLNYLNKELPLKTDNALLEIENKLSDDNFRSKLVNIKFVFQCGMLNIDLIENIYLYNIFV